MSNAPLPSLILTDQRVSVDVETPSKLLDHSPSAARIVGRLNEPGRAGLVSQLADRGDAIAHELPELRGDPRTFAASASRQRSLVAPRVAMHTRNLDGDR